MFEIHSANDIEKMSKKLLALDSAFIFDSTTDYFTVIHEEQLIGYAKTEIENRVCKIIRIFIKDEFRHKGFGQKLVKFIENYAVKNRCEKLVIPEDSEKKFFEKVGFKENEDFLCYDNIQVRKKRHKENSKIIIYSILGNAVLAFTKITLGLKGKSRALMSDGINSLSDIVTSFGMLIGVYFSNQPEDESHPYGHERIETVIANIIGIFMILTAFELGKGSIDLLIKYFKVGKVETTPALNTIFWGLLSAVVKWFMYFYKNKIGRATGNIALVADAEDSRNDIFTSLGAVLGILLAVYINPVFDILLSLPVAILIMKAGIEVIFENANIILDKQDPDFIANIEKYVYENSGISNVHDIQMRTSGDKVFLNMDIRVPNNMTVADAHQLADSIEGSILIEFENVKEVLIHIEPIIE